MPIRHGMTIGELAQLNAERRIGADLTVVTMDGWRRDQWFDQTGLTWVNPSPNMRNLNQAALYPASAPSNTPTSRWAAHRSALRADRRPGSTDRLAAALNARNSAQYPLHPVRFTPMSSVHANQACQGVFMVVTKQGTASAHARRDGDCVRASTAGDQFIVKTSERLRARRRARAREGRRRPGRSRPVADAEAGWRLRASDLLYR
ncbi:MAG: DUF1343 domain-containing protein [Vicinamibacterales bacterium]